MSDREEGMLGRSLAGREEDVLRWDDKERGSGEERVERVERVEKEVSRTRRMDFKSISSAIASSSTMLPRPIPDPRLGVLYVCASAMDANETSRRAGSAASMKHEERGRGAGKSRGAVGQQLAWKRMESRRFGCTGTLYAHTDYTVSVLSH